MNLKTRLLLSIYNDKTYESFFKKVAGDYSDDLHQYIAEVVMGLKEELFNQFEDNDRFRYWVYGVAHRAYNFKTSEFYKEHLRKEYVHPDDLKHPEYDFSKDVDLCIIENILKAYEVEHEDNWYDVMMFKKFIEYGNGKGHGAKAISQKTGIPYSSVRSSIYHMKKVIKERYEHITGVRI